MLLLARNKDTKLAFYQTSTSCPWVPLGSKVFVSFVSKIRSPSREGLSLPARSPAQVADFDGVKPSSFVSVDSRLATESVKYEGVKSISNCLFFRGVSNQVDDNKEDRGPATHK